MFFASLWSNAYENRHVIHPLMTMFFTISSAIFVNNLKKMPIFEFYPGLENSIYNRTMKRINFLIQLASNTTITLLLGMLS